MESTEPNLESLLEAFPGSFFTTDASEIWHRSPLKLDAMRRIFGSVGAELVPEGPELFSGYLALAQIATVALGLSLGKPAAQRKRKVEAAQAYHTFLEALQELLDTPDAPPRPPVVWATEMLRWSENTLMTPGQAGARKNELDHFFVPLVLALYQTVYGREPSSTLGGPTIRFVKAIFQEMSDTVAHSTFEPADAGERSRKAWQPPTETAMQMKIRTFVSEAKSQETFVDHLIQRLYAKLREGSSMH